MFENIPQWLAKKVRDIATDGGPPDRERIYYAAAGWTIAWYLRKNIQAEEADAFFDRPGHGPPEPHPDPEWNDHVNRAVLVADTLFLLRSSPGFEEQRRRLEKRSLRPTFFEMLAAKQVLKAGFEVDAWPEFGERGKDFDFSATAPGGSAVNVEVTALEAERFSCGTILNALKHKASQLPKEGPSVVYVVLPERWWPEVEDWNAVLDRLARRFFGGSQRVNAIVFWIERHLTTAATPPGRALVIYRQTHFNCVPRAKADLSFLIGGVTIEDGMLAINTGEGLANLEKASYQSEFFRWVDSLVPPQSKAAQA